MFGRSKDNHTIKIIIIINYTTPWSAVFDELSIDTCAPGDVVDEIMILYNSNSKNNNDNIKNNNNSNNNNYSNNDNNNNYNNNSKNTYFRCLPLDTSFCTEIRRLVREYLARDEITRPPEEYKK